MFETRNAMKKPEPNVKHENIENYIKIEESYAKVKIKEEPCEYDKDIAPIKIEEPKASLLKKEVKRELDPVCEGECDNFCDKSCCQTDKYCHQKSQNERS